MSRMFFSLELSFWFLCFYVFGYVFCFSVYMVFFLLLSSIKRRLGISGCSCSCYFLFSQVVAFFESQGYFFFKTFKVFWMVKGCNFFLSCFFFLSARTSLAPRIGRTFVLLTSLKHFSLRYNATSSSLSSLSSSSSSLTSPSTSSSSPASIPSILSSLSSSPFGGGGVVFVVFFVFIVVVFISFRRLCRPGGASFFFIWTNQSASWNRKNQWHAWIGAREGERRTTRRSLSLCL